ncbi:EF-P lysine aminoacylase EpmA [Simkania sp.]|uniref:EF-P lysine aminoacylase EpmA n=1 Tax=Simkania sp. TaxID=34094 RepID=UPI003B52BDA7
MFRTVRNFFHKRGVLEVDCPLLSHHAPIDAYIDLFSVDLGEGQQGYLHSSPEYGMKRLLSREVGPIYQLSHVYRKGEAGKKHNPEFTLVEWYRPGFTFEAFLAEVVELIALFLGPLSYDLITYRAAFETYLGIDSRSATEKELKQKMQDLGIDAATEDREELLNLLWGCGIEPHFGRDKLMIVTDFPKSQAMFAQTHEVDGEEVARRFEVSFGQMELGNGYHELCDPIEQKRRLEEANQKRLALGKEKLPIDPFFLKALESGLPDSYGIAIGFDRLMMLRHQVDDIAAVLPFFWNES